ncbi:hypothetical protein [Novosphingobium huizhouense]|uniref:hypothetical protein n=1 Tax=Novosphingobium huizhouense TaxID=2866625 RepID=UPI001CD87B23|nr:hypothetical protein [Novosphingobium huizhouense]
MADTTSTGTTDSAAPVLSVEGANIAADEVTNADAAGTAGLADAKTRFGKAIEEAKAGAAALKDEASARASDARDKAASTAADWQEQAGAYASQARDKGIELAKVGKTRASDALAALGQTISGSAGTIDEKLGVQYGDYARSAARSIQETAASLEAKDFAELGEDLKEAVRKSPAIAVGIAAVAGYALARLIGGSDKSDA